MTTPRATEAMLGAVAGFATILLSGLCVALVAMALGWDPVDPRLLALGMPLQAVGIFGLLALLHHHADDSTRALFALRRPRTALWGLTVLPAGLVGDALVQGVQRWLPELDASSLDMLDAAMRSAGPVRLTMILGVVLLAPVYEELLFRGYVFRGLARSWGGAAAWGMSSLLFGLVHGSPVHVLGAGVIGVWLGLLRWRTGSIWPCVVGHVANNAGWTLVALGGGLPEIDGPLLGAAAALSVICAFSLAVVSQRAGIKEFSAET